MVEKRKKECAITLEKMLGAAHGSNDEERLKGVFQVLAHRHHVVEPTVGFDTEAIYELPEEEYSIWIGVAATASIKRDEVSHSCSLRLALQSSVTNQSYLQPSWACCRCI